MCGRSRTRLQQEQLAAATGIPAERWVGAEHYQPLENAAPGAYLACVHQATPDTPATIHVARWGLVPSFNKPDAKPDFFRMVSIVVVML